MTIKKRIHEKQSCSYSIKIDASKKYRYITHQFFVQYHHNSTFSTNQTFEQCQNKSD